MDLGWCDVCIRVASAALSRSFYADLGFWRVEGDDEDGWAVVTNGRVRLGLFEPEFMKDPFTLNFRGGDIFAIAGELKAKGHIFEAGPEIAGSGASAVLRDPDGRAIFFETTFGETRQDDPMPEYD